MTASPIHRADLNLVHKPAEPSFLKLQPKLLAIPKSRLQRINLDLTTMIGITHAASEKVLTLRDEIARQLPLFDLAFVDELEDASLALDHTHGWVQCLAHPDDGLEDLNLEATQTRARAIQDLRNLAAHGLIDPGRLSEFVGRPGYKIVISDVRLCVHVYELEWPNIEGKTCCTRADIDRAAAVIHRMSLLVGLRSAGRARANEWVDWRERAFTLLFNHYGEVRRAVQYLRYHQDDVDSFAPSLFKCRMKRRRKQVEEEVPNPPPKEPKEPEQPVYGVNGPFVGVEGTAKVGPTESRGGTQRENEHMQ